MDVIVTGKNYESCCRTCLQDDSEEMVDIFENGTDSVNTAEILTKYTSIKITMEDELPKKLCSNCYSCLISFHNFSNIALNVDTKLREYFTNQVKKEDINIKHVETFCEMPIKIEIDVDHYDSIEENIDISPLDETSKDSKYSEKHSVKLVCEICNKKCRNQKSLQRHKSHHEKVYDCMLCHETFSNSQLYIQHLGSHNQGLKEDTEVNANSQSLVCDVCSCTFKSVPSLSAHKRVHIPKNRVLQCTTCSKIFKKISHLKRHELSHIDNRPYKCSLCLKSFMTEDLLKAHMDKHNGVNQHCCPICMRMFCQLRTLNNHMKMHTREKPFLCPTCGKMFESNTNLNQHIKRHAGLKLFACNMCPRKFVSKGELKSHATMHSGERSFACDQCSSTFTKRSSLGKHKIIHLGVKPHQCDVCNMKFAYKNHLQRHYRIHTGEKPYRCEICDRAFTQTNDLVKHKRTHLGNNLYKCEECSQSFRLKSELNHHISEHFISAQNMKSKVDNITQCQTLESNATSEMQAGMVI